jgi:integrase
MARLTAKAVENIKPREKRVEIPDGGSGLYLVVQPSGRKSWAVRYRFEGKPKKLTLGGTLTLAAARQAASEALHGLDQGNDPVAAGKAAKIKAAATAADTVTAVCEEYLHREGKKLRTVNQRVAILSRLVYPHFGDRPIEGIKRSEVIRLLDKIEDASGPRMADVTLAVLRRVFHWHALRSDDFRSPIVRGMARQNAVEHRRSRTLTDDELHRVWLAATAEKGPFGSLIRFLLLTTARRGEAAAMTWGEIDGTDWVLPAARNKVKTNLVRPLSGAAVAILAEQPRIDGANFVFTSNGLTPLASFSLPKERLDAASGVTDWRLHDLRRTARSLLSRVGVSADIAEMCLGHTLPSIRATYDRYQYRAEMLHAFEALAAQIKRIVDPPQGGVIPLRRRG